MATVTNIGIRLTARDEVSGVLRSVTQLTSRTIESLNLFSQRFSSISENIRSSMTALNDASKILTDIQERFATIDISSIVNTIQSMRGFRTPGGGMEPVARARAAEFEPTGAEAEGIAQRAPAFVQAVREIFETAFMGYRPRPQTFEFWNREWIANLQRMIRESDPSQMIIPSIASFGDPPRIYEGILNIPVRGIAPPTKPAAEAAGEPEISEGQRIRTQLAEIRSKLEGGGAEAEAEAERLRQAAIPGFFGGTQQGAMAGFLFPEVSEEGILSTRVPRAGEIVRRRGERPAPGFVGLGGGEELLKFPEAQRFGVQQAIGGEERVGIAERLRPRRRRRKSPVERFAVRPIEEGIEEELTEPWRRLMQQRRQGEEILQEAVEGTPEITEPTYRTQVRLPEAQPAAESPVSYIKDPGAQFQQSSLTGHRSNVVNNFNISGIMDPDMRDQIVSDVNNSQQSSLAGDPFGRSAD